MCGIYAHLKKYDKYFVRILNAYYLLFASACVFVSVQIRVAYLFTSVQLPSNDLCFVCMLMMEIKPKFVMFAQVYTWISVIEVKGKILD